MMYLMVRVGSLAMVLSACTFETTVDPNPASVAVVNHSDASAPTMVVQAPVAPPAQPVEAAAPLAQDAGTDAAQRQDAAPVDAGADVAAPLGQNTCGGILCQYAQDSQFYVDVPNDGGNTYASQPCLDLAPGWECPAGWTCWGIDPQTHNEFSSVCGQ